MLISASYRTDIPAFYGSWFLNRLRAGWAGVVNPYSSEISRVSLDPADVDGIVFWTRNIGPFLPVLDHVHAVGLPFVVQYTVTGYPRALDASTIPVELAISHLRTIVQRFGSRVAVWRYDPVVFSSVTPAQQHEEGFSRLCQSLAGVVDEVVLSVMQPYRKTRRALDRAATAHGFSWIDPDSEEKTRLLARLAVIARSHDISATICGQPELLVPGLGEAACIDLRRLSDLAGRAIQAPRKPHRPDCACWASRDIGAYDSCQHGCAYCYAVGSVRLARERHRAHDPDGACLFPPLAKKTTCHSGGPG